MPKKRTKIPSDVEARLMANNRHTCCLCHEHKDVVIHHIDEDSSNNNPENLCVLCTGCHSDVHSNQGLGRKFTLGELRIYKKEWEERCKVENTKKNIIYNIYVFTELNPDSINMDLARRTIINVSSGATIAEVNENINASADIIAESTGNPSTADKFKFFVLNQCDNFLIPGKCDKWIIDRFELKEFKGEIDYLTTPDYEKADLICSKCSNFKPKK